MSPEIRFPAEFEPHSFVQLIFPHAQSDWAPYLGEACRTFAQIARGIARFEPCLIVCDDIARVKTYFTETENLHFVHYLADDTWARDCSAITVYEAGSPKLQDFVFTGWGGKFEASKDNAMTRTVAGCYDAPVAFHDFILEGGAVESDGRGTLLTTEQCLLNPNRNSGMDRNAVEAVLKETLGVVKILWLKSGYLAGDDTDSHIDTLARFCDAQTICYVKCDDIHDEHYAALKHMEQELEGLRDPDGLPYRLVPLPMTEPLYYDGERLPATYANFLIVNGGVLVPTYGDCHDAQALEIFAGLFPGREIVGIDCSVLVRQHGSLHCVTMQFPQGVALLA